MTGDRQANVEGSIFLALILFMFIAITHYAQKEVDKPIHECERKEGVLIYHPIQGQICVDPTTIKRI